MRKKSILFISLAAFLLLSTGCSVISQLQSESVQQGNAHVTNNTNKEPGENTEPGNSKDPEGSKVAESDKEKDPGKEKEGETVDPDTVTSTWMVTENSELPIYNAEHQEIGSISCLNYSNFTDQGILYTKIPEGDDTRNGTSRVEFHLYDIENKEDHYLTTVDDWFYTASYEAVEKDDHLYIGVSTGDYVERANRTLTIYNIDLENYEMNPLLVVEGGIPYDSYTIAGDKLYLAELLDTGKSDLITIDLKNKPDKPIYHAYSEADVFVTGSVRRIISDDDYVYMLILSWENEKYYLTLDTYDHDLKRLKTVDITSTCLSSFNENNPDSGDAQNERMQFVGAFAIKDQMFFYKNFSVTTFLGLFKDNRLERFQGTDDLIEMVSTPYADTDLMLLRIYGDDSTERTERNLFYRFSPADHSIQTADFYADNVLYTFRCAFQNSRGKLLLDMGYQSEDGEVLPDRLYYLDINDLHFE